jgi:phosphate starvation-inducible PhoH-like protein
LAWIPGYVFRHIPLHKHEKSNLSEIILTIEGVDLVELYGENNVKLNLLRKAYPDVTMTSRGNNLKLAGERKTPRVPKANLK